MKEFFFLSVKDNLYQLLKKLTPHWVVSASPLRSSVWKGQYQQCYVLVLQATAHKTLVRDSLTKSTGWRGWGKEGVKLQDETLLFLSFHSYFLKAKQKLKHHPTFPCFDPKLARTKTQWIISMHLKLAGWNAALQKWLMAGFHFLLFLNWGLCNYTVT